MFCCLLDPARPPNRVALEAVARACSPRVERGVGSAVVFDVGGLERVLGPPPAMAVEIERLAIAQALTPQLAIAGTMTAAWLLAHGRPGRTVVPKGEEAAALTGLGIQTLATLTEEVPRPRAQGPRERTAESASLGPGTLGLGPSGDLLAIFLLWGLRTLGDLARLPEADVRTRLGTVGARLHQAACGQDAAPLVPVAEPARFVERLELEWPIDGLEPLSFVFARLCESLSDTLDRADRGAVTVTTRLHLTTRTTHERVLNLPAPMRDARVLRALILLDLESHPPAAAIDVVEIEVHVTPGRIVQGSLLASRSLASPEDLSTLIARLSALMGESRVGAPRLVDTHDERAVGMKGFTAPAARSALLPPAFCLLPCLRRFRLPVAVTVDVEHGAPVRVKPSACGLTGGRVIASAGPWRSSGGWWAADVAGGTKSPGLESWDRDQWEVELADGVYRLARDRTTRRWEIEGVID